MRKGILFIILCFQFTILRANSEVVVGIHGFLSTADSMKTVKEALEFCDCDVYLWSYPSRSKFIEEHACNLVTFLQEIACNCPGKPIHFVTHSIGALVLRSALNTPTCPEEAKIGRAVLLAPPNQGSILARRFRNFMPISLALGGKSGWELMNYAPYQISYFGEFPPCMSVLVVAGTKGNQVFFSTPNDGFLAIEETRLNTAFYFTYFPVSHGGLLTSVPVLRCTRTFIRSGIESPSP